MQLARVPLASGEYELDGHPPHVSVDAPTDVEYLPAPHFAQTSAPVDVLYLPATQDVQAPPSGPDVPMLHVQLARVPLPSNE